MNVLAFVALLVLACSSTPGERWREAHPDFARRPPAAGQSMGEAVASLEEPRAPHRIEVSGLRLLAVGTDPWQALDAASALDLEPRPDELHALIALRTCRHRAGLRRSEVARASWLLFQGGRLEAYDAWEFAEACAPRHHFLPAPEAQRRLERDLSRDVARRHPATALGPGETFRKGLVYLARERIEDAEAMLALGSRALSEASRAADEDAPDAPAEPALAEARALRAELTRALRETRGSSADPEAEFWKGR